MSFVPWWNNRNQSANSDLVHGEQSSSIIAPLISHHDPCHFIRSTMCSVGKLAQVEIRVRNYFSPASLRNFFSHSITTRCTLSEIVMSSILTQYNACTSHIRNKYIIDSVLSALFGCDLVYEHINPLCSEDDTTDFVIFQLFLSNPICT